MKRARSNSSRSSGGIRKKARVTPTRSATPRLFVPRTVGNAMALSERKYYDTGMNGVISLISSAWTGTEIDPTTRNALFTPQEGNDIDNRVGRKVQVHAIKIRGQIELTEQTASTAVMDNQMVRLILYIDNQSNGTQSQGEDVIDSPATIGGDTTGPLNFYQNTKNFGRFKVLKDKMFSLTPTAAANNASATTISTVGPRRSFVWNIKFKKPLIVKFNATNGGTVADIVDKSFHLIAAKQVSNPVVNYLYRCRTVYTD